MTDTAGGSTSAPAGEAAIPVSPAPHIVHLAERCPGSPHPFDVVTLRRKASIPMGIAVSVVLGEAAGDNARVQAGLALEFLRYGIEAWSFHDLVDEETIRVPVTEPIERDVLERWLPFHRGGLEVVEAASALYGDDVLDPFVRRLKAISSAPKSETPSMAGLGESSTSASNGSGSMPPKPSKRSSLLTVPAGTSSEAPAP
jgi:hypothetical protein